MTTDRLLGWFAPAMAAALSMALPAQQVMVATDPVVFGQRFELVVTTTQPFAAERLSPLVVELLSQTSRGGVDELRFAARCYEVGEVVLALDPPYALRVASCLPEPDGGLEWPSDGWQLDAEAGRSWPLLGLFGLLVAALAWRATRGKGSVGPEAAAALAPRWDALAALRQLATEGVTGDAFYARLKAILRKHCAARFHLPAEVRTSEELLRALPKALPTLQPCLMTCDVVLFGGAAADDSRQDPATRDGARDHAIQFVESTQVGAHVVEVSA